MTAKDVIEYFKFCKSAVETCNEALGLAVEALEKPITPEIITNLVQEMTEEK